MTAHISITYHTSNSVPQQLAVQSVPIGGIVPPIHPPQLLNPGQDVEFDIEAGWELIVTAASVTQQASLARPVPASGVLYPTPQATLTGTTYPSAVTAGTVKPLYTAPTIPPLKGEWVPPVVPVVTGVSQR
jgi:hypothetical protein